jgi:hypothetical protein
VEPRANRLATGFRAAETVSKQREQKTTKYFNLVNRLMSNKNEGRAAFALASAIREATMYKENTLFLHSSVEDMCPNNVFGQTFSDSDWDVQDKRVAQLLVLLKQLHESPGGLGALPKPELGEVVSSAVRLCGFVNPIEARDVIDTVLASLEMEDPIPKHQ